MALKDLVSDLSNFKYGMTSPDQVDNQIENGVDFFPNDDASGFTPKTDLESLYNKVQDGTFDKVWPEAAKINEKTRAAYGADGEYDVPEGVGISNPSHIFSSDNILGPMVHPQFKSPFLDTPIADAVSMFNEDPFSVTLGTKAEPLRGDKRFNDRTYYINGRQPGGYSGEFPFIPNAHTIGEDWGYNLPVQRSSAGNTQIPIVNDKRRGVFDHLVNTTFEHQPFPVNQQPGTVFNPTYDRYFSEMSGKSIHISPSGELKAGLRYGAGHTFSTIGAEEELIYFTQFANFNSGNILRDTATAPWSSDVTLGDRLSVYDNYVESEGYPSRMVLGSDTILPKWPEIASTSPLNPTNISPSPYGLGNQILSGLDNTDNLDDQLRPALSILKDSWEDRFEFTKKGNNTFKNVPAGLNQNNKFENSDFRKVANKGPFDGNDNHPLILREVGNNWGIDTYSAENPLGDAIGGIVRGAPGITGYISRTFTDRIRLAKWLFTTSEGLGFNIKQFALQALNPTLESKIYNPLSALSITGASDLIDAFSSGFSDPAGLARTLGSSLASVFFQIGHPERHLGNGRYEDVVPLGKKLPDFILNMLPSGMDTVLSPIDFSKENTGFGSRIAMQSNPEIIPSQTLDFGIFGSFTFGGSDLPTSMMMMNPNKYLFPISSAPKSVDKGVPSFTGTTDVLRNDVRKIENQKGGTFNKNTNQSYVNDKEGSGLVKRHSTLSYDRLTRAKWSYMVNKDQIMSPGELNKYVDGEGLGVENWSDAETRIDSLSAERKKGNDIVQNLGDPGKTSGWIHLDGETTKFTAASKTDLGVIKGTAKTPNVDKVNIHPYGSKDLEDNIKDFIKFRFKDVTNNKFIIFRAILDGISDAIAPEYGEERYIGRPDKVYVYQGTNRSVNFNFKVYPKTKQEMPVLLEKVNYLVGLCYPTYTEGERMITPFMELTIGDMFVDTPGLMESVTVTVEDSSTWEIENGLQFPHFISVACVFKHIGKYILHGKGKHYDLPWIPDGSTDDRMSANDLGFKNSPYRKKYATLFQELGQSNTS